LAQTPARTTEEIVVKPSERDQLCVNTLRVLSVDMVEKANSGHPGLPMGARGRCRRPARVHLGHGPRNDLLTRQLVPTLDRAVYAPAELLRRGAYVLNPSDERHDPDVILIASGSEVALIGAAEPILRKANANVRLVSIRQWRLFEEQTAQYRESVLPMGVTARLAVEVASPLGWERWTGAAGAILGIDRFGSSAPGATLQA
jgi:transketolase